MSLQSIKAHKKQADTNHILLLYLFFVGAKPNLELARSVCCTLHNKLSLGIILSRDYQSFSWSVFEFFFNQEGAFWILSSQRFHLYEKVPQIISNYPPTLTWHHNVIPFHCISYDQNDNILHLFCKFFFQFTVSPLCLVPKVKRLIEGKESRQMKMFNA